MTDPKEWKANRAKWVEALRDPSRKQVPGVLGHPDRGQCCLGVLAEISGCIYGRDERFGDDCWDGECSFAPPRAMEFVGLRTMHGAYQRGSLADHNDKYFMSFAQIADLIESEPGELFHDAS